MKAAARPPHDRSYLSVADRVFFQFESALNFLGGIVIFLLVLLTTANVLGRWLFSYPITGYIDWVEQSMAFMAFLGIAYAGRLGTHIRMDMLISKLHGRSLWFVEFVSTCTMLIISLLLTYGSYLHFRRAYDLGDSSFDIDLPTWPAKLVVPFALSILSIRLILLAWGYARAFWRNDRHPIAVPLIPDAATVAAEEADAVMGEAKAAVR